jgi:hypothetical protein
MSIASPGRGGPHAQRKPSLINVWVDPDAFAPGTMNQTMYK